MEEIDKSRIIIMLSSWPVYYLIILLSYYLDQLGEEKVPGAKSLSGAQKKPRLSVIKTCYYSSNNKCDKW